MAGPPNGLSPTASKGFVYNGRDQLTDVQDALSANAELVKYVFDDAGHTTSRTVTGVGTTTYGWNADDTLQWAKDPGGNQLAGFKYEAGALRRRKASSTAAEGDRVYVYDGSSLVAELDAATGAPKLEYIYGTELWGVIDYSASQSNPTVQWMHRDGMRSVVERTANLGSGAARVAGPFRYDAFGGYRTTPEAAQPGADGQSKVGYTGHVFDVETGLVYAKARYYQPELGRWLSQDALEGQMDLAPSLNRYAYVFQNPYRYWDPTGYAGTCSMGSGAAQCIAAEAEIAGQSGTAGTAASGSTAAAGEGATATGMQTSVTTSTSGSGAVATGVEVPTASAVQTATTGAKLPWWKAVAVALGIASSDSETPEQREARLKAEYDRQTRELKERFAANEKAWRSESTQERQDAPGVDTTPSGAPGVAKEPMVAPGASSGSALAPSGQPSTPHADPEKGKGPMEASRRSAFREAKRDSHIPKSQHPDQQQDAEHKQYKRVPMTKPDGTWILDTNGQPIMTREYTYTLPNGTKIIIQDHGAGHEFVEGGVGDQPPHHNADPRMIRAEGRCQEQSRTTHLSPRRSRTPSRAGKGLINELA